MVNPFILQATDAMTRIILGINRKDSLLLSQSIGLAFTVLASGNLRYFVALLQKQQEGRGGAENTRHAR